MQKMKIEFSRGFRKAAKRLKASQGRQLLLRLNLFKEQPNHPQLNNHALHGKMKGYYSINITGDFRAIYLIEECKKKEEVIKFAFLGSHSQLY